MPPGCILDSEGRPTDDPKAFYASPPGAILRFGGHKGYGLSVLAEVLAGRFTGGSCSHFGVDRVANNMLSIILDPAVFVSGDAFSAEILAFIDHVKSSRTVTEDGEILTPGEPEARCRSRRLATGSRSTRRPGASWSPQAYSLGVTIDASG